MTRHRTRMEAIADRLAVVDRIEDVARTMYHLESLDTPNRFNWTLEPVGYVKTMRDRARDLIARFDDEHDAEFGDGTR